MSLKCKAGVHDYAFLYFTLWSRSLLYKEKKASSVECSQNAQVVM